MSYLHNKKGLLTSVVTFVFLALVAYLLYQNLQEIKWSDVTEAVEKVSASTMALAGLVTITIYGILTTYDYMGFRHLKLDYMTYPRVMISAFLCYAFNFNLGAVVGGVGFRFRIYTGWKVPRGKVPSVVLFSTFTNWSGFIFLSALVLFLQDERLKKLIPVPDWVLTFMGVICLAGPVLYAWACYHQQNISFKGAQFTFPRLRMLLIQLPLASLQWTLPSVIIGLFLKGMGHDVPFGELLAVYLMAGFLGAVSHIPAGLGLIEAAFLRAGFEVPPSDMLAALLCFRSVYYLIPLLVAIPSYLALEYHQKNNVAAT